jgi:serine protease inhibitor
MIIVSKLSPVWLYKINKVVKGHNNQRYCVFVGTTFDYYTDQEIHMLEIPLAGERYTIGFIKHKKNHNMSTHIKQLTMAINYLKPTVFDEVLIPIVKQRYKTRLNKTLQQGGISRIFDNNVQSSLFPEGSKIDDCIVYTDIVFGSKSANVKCVNKGYRTTNTFVCDKGIEFYLRDREVNCILMMGKL